MISDPLLLHHIDEQYSVRRLHRARDLNLILGSQYVVMASADPIQAGGWKAIATS